MLSKEVVNSSSSSHGVWRWYMSTSSTPSSRIWTVGPPVGSPISLKNLGILRKRAMNALWSIIMMMVMIFRGKTNEKKTRNMGIYTQADRCVSESSGGGVL